MYLCYFSLSYFFPILHYIVTNVFMRVEFKEDDGSDDNRSSSLGRSVQSDNASLASDNQDDGAPECELTIRMMLPVCVCVCFRLFVLCRHLIAKSPLH